MSCYRETDSLSPLLSMHNKRIIWLTFFLILCMVGGGLYHALSSGLPCKITCTDDLLTQLRFSMKYKHHIVSELLQYAKQKEEDVTKWDRVEITHFRSSWFCSVYRQNEKEHEALGFESKENGEFVTRKTARELAKEFEEGKITAGNLVKEVKIGRDILDEFNKECKEQIRQKVVAQKEAALKKRN